MKYNTAKKIVQVAALGSLLGGCGVDGGYAYLSETAPPMDFELPDRLTPEQPIYDNPGKEFEVYREAYAQFTLDRVLDTKEITALEFILRKTIMEIEKKTGYVNRIWNLEAGSEKRKYHEFVGDLRSDVIELWDHLDLKKAWLDYSQDNFWHHGAGVFAHASGLAKGNLDYESTYKMGLNEVFAQEFYPKRFRLEIRKLSDDYPFKTKMPYGLGLLLGSVLPGLLVYGTRRLRKEKWETTDTVYSVTNPALGFLLLDSIHPLIYPVRIAASLVYSHVFKESVDRPIAPQNPIIIPTEAKPAKVKLTDPWEVDIPEIE